MATWVGYELWLEAQADGNLTNTPVDFDADTIRVALVTSSYTPSQAHNYFDDVSANEVSGTNYTADGAAVATKTVGLAANTVTFDGDDITWSQHAGGFSNARYAILQKDSGVAATSPLIAYADMGADKGNVDGDLTLQFAATGIMTWVFV